MGSCR